MMLRSRITLRFIVCALGAVFLLVCCAVTAFIRTAAQPSANGRGLSAPKVAVAWKFRAANIRSVTLSPTGANVATVGSDGTVSLYSHSGEKLYSTLVPGATTALAAPGGMYTVAYARLDPLNTSLTFLDKTGCVYWQVRVSGAIWCADACRYEDYTRFVVGTGERYLYTLDVGEGIQQYRRARISGVVVSVSIGPDGESVTTGTWQASSITSMTLDGKRLWEAGADQASLQYIEPLASSDRVFARSIPNKRDTDGVFTLFDRSGACSWRGTISSSQQSHVLVSPNGEYVCVGCNRLITHKGKSMRERHAVEYDSSGKVLWDKGSAFFQADPILVAFNGYALLDDGKTGVWVMSPAGELKPAIKLPAPIKRAIAAKGSSRAVLECSDGWMYVLNVVQ